MPSTSKLALPYPASTDLVKDGAADIQALADRVEALTMAAPSGASPPHETALPSTYPTGVSVAVAMGAQDWPVTRLSVVSNSVAGVVVTARVPKHGSTTSWALAQYFHERNGGAVWHRHGIHDTGTGINQWDDWTRADVAEANLAPVAGDAPSAFPAGWSAAHSADPSWPGGAGAAGSLVTTFRTALASGTNLDRVVQTVDYTPTGSGAVTAAYRRSGVVNVVSGTPDYWGAWVTL